VFGPYKNVQAGPYVLPYIRSSPRNELPSPRGNEDVWCFSFGEKNEDGFLRLLMMSILGLMKMSLRHTW
jgi:hypothetical protein